MRMLSSVAMCAALGGMALTATGGPAGAARAPSRSYEITFDGYCDGLQLRVPSAGLGTDITVDGAQIGCDSGALYGQASGAAQRGPGHGTEYVTLVDSALFVVIRSDHTFAFYLDQSGGVILEALTGTWSPGKPAPDGAGSASAAATAAELPQARVAQPPQEPTAQIRHAREATPAGGVDLSFDGSCDGMHLVSPSVGEGTKKTVDGHQTGCRSAGLIGAKATVDKQKGTYVVQWAGGVTQSAIFPDHTWIHYIDDGGKIAVLASGTWSAGKPQPTGTAAHPDSLLPPPS